MSKRENAKHLKRLEALCDFIQNVYRLENLVCPVAELQALGTEYERMVIQAQIRNLQIVLKQLGDN